MSEMSLARVEASNLPASQKSSIRRWYEKTMGGMSEKARVNAGLQARAAGHALRQTGESVIVGGALGAIEGHFGTLDYQPSKAHPQIVIPIDGTVAAAGLVAGVLLGYEEVGADLRNTGAAAASIFTYRKTKEFVSNRKASVHGEGDVGFGSDEDPVALAARGL